MEEFAMLIGGFIVVLILAIGLGLPIVSQLYNSASGGTASQVFSATAGVPVALTYEIESVTSLDQLNQTIQTNSTTTTLPVNYTFTISNLASTAAILNLTHTPNIAVEFRSCNVNSIYLVNLSDASLDSFTLPSGILQNGINTVNCQ